MSMTIELIFYHYTHIDGEDDDDHWAGEKHYKTPLGTKALCGHELIPAEEYFPDPPDVGTIFGCVKCQAMVHKLVDWGKGLVIIDD